MGIENIANRVRTLVQQDDSFTYPNDCRNSVVKLRTSLEEQFPKANINFLVYPEAKEGDGVHYALSASIDDGELLINLVPAPGFPEFIGDREKATPTFSSFVVTPNVI